MNSLVLSDEQRAAATDPVIRQLIPLIPRANFFDADGTPRFVGSAPAVVDTDRWTVDVRHNVGRQRSRPGVLREPARPGGRARRARQQHSGVRQRVRPFASILTINDTHIFGAALLNEARFGRSRLRGGTFPATPLNPADFGIRQRGDAPDWLAADDRRRRSQLRRAGHPAAGAI